MPDNYGDVILGQAVCKDPHLNKLAEMIRYNIPKKKAEGVKDQDIRLAWNLNDVERRMMEAEDDLNRMAGFIGRLGLGDTPEKAAESGRKHFPMYGDPANTRLTTGDDRPLPFELRIRINDYMVKRIANDPEKFKTEVEQSTTFNALIRREIRAGKL